MEFDALWLSRLQFALTIMFHYLFPPADHRAGGDAGDPGGACTSRPATRGYKAAAKFWTKIFALNFAMGVATGIVMEFQFGTNWATYSRYVGDVFGSALAAEGIFAFFLESGFLAVLVFGWDRVSPRMHFFSHLMVASGSIFSSIWIVVANSWQQTPAGYHLVETINGWTQSGPRSPISGRVVFNPSTMHRLVHVLDRGVHPRRLLRDEHHRLLHPQEAARGFRPTKSFTVALVRGGGRIAGGPGLGPSRRPRTCTAPSRPRWRRSKGTFRTSRGRHPAALFGFPDEQTQTVEVRCRDSRAC